jgi:hypothetical protein
LTSKLEKRGDTKISQREATKWFAQWNAAFALRRYINGTNIPAQTAKYKYTWRVANGHSATQ